MLDSPRFSTTRSADQAQWTSPASWAFTRCRRHRTTWVNRLQALHVAASTSNSNHRAAETRRASAEWPTAMLVAARSAFWVPWSMLKGHLDNSRYNIYIYMYMLLIALASFCVRGHCYPGTIYKIPGTIYKIPETIYKIPGQKLYIKSQKLFIQPRSYLLHFILIHWG